MISSAQLCRAGIGMAQADAFVDPLNAALTRFDLQSPARIAAFLGQCMVESTMLKRIEESFEYSPQGLVATFGYYAKRPEEAEEDGYVKDAAGHITREANQVAIANKVYANRYGNGDVASGDGYRNRGRGLIQLTFHDNYAEATRELGIDFVGNPDLAAKPVGACLVSAWFFHVHKLDALADAGAIDSITHVVNPPMLAADRRRQYTQQVLQALTT